MKTRHRLGNRDSDSIIPRISICVEAEAECHNIYVCTIYSTILTISSMSYKLIKNTHK